MVPVDRRDDRARSSCRAAGGRGWTRRQLVAAGVFGIATALMNTFFYLAIDRVDLGKAVTIEFIGPITVAAVATRSLRNAVALLFAVGGVVVLGQGEIDGNALGLLFILLASTMWAVYIVVGSKVAQLDRGVAGLGIGLAIGALVMTPVGAPWSGPVWTSPSLLAACLLVGVFSNAIGYGIDQFVMRRIPIRRFSVLLALLPVTALAVGWIVLDQQPSGVELLGVALVLVGVATQEREELDRGTTPRSSARSSPSRPDSSRWCQAADVTSRASEAAPSQWRRSDPGRRARRVRGSRCGRGWRR